MARLELFVCWATKSWKTLVILSQFREKGIVVNCTERPWRIKPRTLSLGDDDVVCDGRFFLALENSPAKTGLWHIFMARKTLAADPQNCSGEWSHCSIAQSGAGDFFSHQNEWFGVFSNVSCFRLSMLVCLGKTKMEQWWQGLVQNNIIFARYVMQKVFPPFSVHDFVFFRPHLYPNGRVVRNLWFVFLVVVM